MSNIRLFFNESLYINLKSKLDKTQSHYIHKVMRIKEGQNFSLFNQSGEFEAKVENIIRGIVEFSVEKKLRSANNPTEIWLAFTPIKLNYLNLMIQKATELGVTRFIPLLTDHTVVRKINEKRIKDLKRGIDIFNEFKKIVLKRKKIIFTNSINSIKKSNLYIITVPTPINNKNLPDLTPLRQSTQAIASVLSKDDIVIYESTVYPGVTEEECVPILEEVSGLKFNKDFFCGYSPERINPGDKERTLTKILKITSGSTHEVAKRVDELYKSIITAGTHLAPSIKVAEAAKVIENTQRDVNIALVNELALIFDTMGISSSDVLEAAGTKWNFLNFKPGLVGGHCIGVDPYYLTYKAEKMGYKPNLILSSRQINNGMSAYIAKKTIRLLVEEDKNS